MHKVSTKKKVSPRRAPHTGRRPKAHVIGPDVLCAQPKPPKKPRKPRAKKPSIVSGPPVVVGSTVSGSAVRAMAGSLAATKLCSVKTVLESENSLFRNLDVFQTMLFAGAMVFLGKDMRGLAVSLMSIGTFAPMLIRIGLAKWRDKLVWTSAP